MKGKTVVTAAAVALVVGGTTAGAASSLITGGQIATHTITKVNLSRGVLSALDRTSTPGFTGAQGPAGPQGMPGAVGPQGPSGRAGATGPQGSQGPAGPAGTQGPQGPTIDAATQVYEVFGSNVSVGSGGFISGQVGCNSNDAAINGGWSGFNFVVQTTEPFFNVNGEPTTWYIDGNVPFGQYGDFTPYVICLK